MADAVVVVRHIRVGGATLCGKKMRLGVHAVTWTNYTDADCLACLDRRKVMYEEAARKRRGQARETETRSYRFLNTPRIK